MTAYEVLVLAVALERVAELVVSRRHLRWALDHGGRESGARHYPLMVALHAGLLVACVVEVRLGGRPVVPVLAAAALAVLVLSQGLRWWCVASLGRRWTTRIVTVPGEPLVTAGPYRWVRHPNYLAVAAEGVALPLVHTAWLTAACFTVLNAVLLLAIRIPAEERALAAAELPVAPGPQVGTPE